MFPVDDKKNFKRLLLAKNTNCDFKIPRNFTENIHYQLIYIIHYKSVKIKILPVNFDTMSITDCSREY